LLIVPSFSADNKIVTDNKTEHKKSVIVIPLQGSVDSTYKFLSELVKILL